MKQFAQSSGELSADATIYTGRCALTGVNLISDGTNDPTLILKDGGSSGTVKLELKLDLSVCGIFADHYDFSHPVIFDTDIYADFTGTNATYCVEYVSIDAYR